MALSFVGASSGVASASLPSGWQAGDLAVVFAYRDGNNTAPTLPTGWTDIISGGANTNSERVGYRVLQAGDTGTGTWTNATSVVCLVYRGQRGSAPIGASAQNGGNSTTVNYPALTLQDTSGNSWVAGFAGHRSTDTALETPPTGMVNRANVVDATDEAAGHDTNGGVTSWPSTNVSVGGTASGWRSAVVEILSNIVTIGATIAGAGTVTSNLTRIATVAATISGASGVTADLTVSQPGAEIASTIFAGSSVSAGAAAIRGLSATSLGSSSISASATALRGLSATPLGASGVAVSAIVLRGLSSTAAGAGSVAASLTVIQPGIVEVAAAIPATGGASAGVTAIRGMAVTTGSVSTFSSSVSAVVGAAATMAGGGSIVAPLTVTEKTPRPKIVTSLFDLN
jgi:hypothetical protein